MARSDGWASDEQREEHVLATAVVIDAETQCRARWRLTFQTEPYPRIYHCFHCATPTSQAPEIVTRAAQTWEVPSHCIADACGDALVQRLVERHN